MEIRLYIYNKVTMFRYAENIMLLSEAITDYSNLMKSISWI